MMKVTETIFSQQGIHTWISSDLRKVEAVRKRSTPELSYTVADTTWLSNAAQSTAM